MNSRTSFLIQATDGTGISLSWHLIERRPNGHQFLVAARLAQRAEEPAEARTRGMDVQESHWAVLSDRERMPDVRRHLHPRHGLAHSREYDGRRLPNGQHWRVRGDLVATGPDPHPVG
jgi:hypothetical protein